MPVLNGNISFDETSSSEQLLLTLPINGQTKITSMFIDFAASTKITTAILYSKIDGTNFREIIRYTPESITATINLVGWGAVDLSRESKVVLVCDGSGAESKTIYYNLNYSIIDNPERVLNGTFDSDSEWSKTGSTISDGKGHTTSSAFLQQTLNGLTPNVPHILSFDVVANEGSGSIGFTTAGEFTGYASGHHYIIFIPSAKEVLTLFNTGYSGSVDWDNISIVKIATTILSQDQPYYLPAKATDLLDAQAVRDAMKLAPSAGEPETYSIDDKLQTIGVVASDTYGAVNSLNNLSQQDVRDSMKLAPSGGDPAEGSVDDLVETVDTVVDAIKTKTDQLTFTNANKVDAASLITTAPTDMALDSTVAKAAGAKGTDAIYDKAIDIETDTQNIQSTMNSVALGVDSISGDMSTVKDDVAETQITVGETKALVEGLNNISLAEIEASTVLAKESTLENAASQEYLETVKADTVKLKQKIGITN